jgi:transcriptional/translational regulatory protein YebC/TACO1
VDVATYTRDVEAYRRVSQRKGLKHKPATVVEMMGLQHDQMERLIRVLEGLEDVARFHVSCSSSSLVGLL